MSHCAPTHTTPPAAPPPTSLLSAMLRPTLILLAFMSVCTFLLAGAYLWTNPIIEATLQAEKRRFVQEVLPAGAYDNDPLSDTVTLADAPELGMKEAVIYRARKAGQPAALVMEAVAPDGYGGPIRLIFGIDTQGVLTGVRIAEQKETPGLGDYIDPAKDRNKKSPWLFQFNHLNTETLPDDQWKVKKDHGHFDSRAGATVSPRAVVKALHKAVRFAMQEKDALFEEKQP
ncbi:MAG: electron transport complex subunit RsxG [Zoogloeaceae bacterium]|jgi:electron transport complex protein RnfG|nr:electron transport complex subunit RsxG [Zoogloeaceae bacterium]